MTLNAESNLQILEKKHCSMETKEFTDFQNCAISDLSIKFRKLVTQSLSEANKIIFDASNGIYFCRSLHLLCLNYGLLSAIHGW